MSVRRKRINYDPRRVWYILGDGLTIRISGFELAQTGRNSWTIDGAEIIISGSPDDYSVLTEEEHDKERPGLRGRDAYLADGAEDENRRKHSHDRNGRAGGKSPR